jgi:hypothetical protein
MVALPEPVPRYQSIHTALPGAELRPETFEGVFRARSQTEPQFPRSEQHTRHAVRSLQTYRNTVQWPEHKRPGLRGATCVTPFLSQMLDCRLPKRHFKLCDYQFKLLQLTVVKRSSNEKPCSCLIIHRDLTTVTQPLKHGA